MADATNLSLAEEQSSSDEETVKGDRDDDHIVDILEEERQASTNSIPPIGTSIKNRYRELLEVEQESASDDGSTDAIPRRVASPIDSLLSIPDDSPSIQVL